MRIAVLILFLSHFLNGLILAEESSGIDQANKTDEIKLLDAARARDLVSKYRGRALIVRQKPPSEGIRTSGREAGS
jgi:hypothetical protein